MTTPDLALESIRELPKVVLHDHLDGGLRPSTVLELAHEIGHELPADDLEGLQTWFRDSADSGSLVSYLETFEHTIAVMQTQDALARVAFEAAEDLARDGVVYAEIRQAPELNTAGGLSIDQVVAAIQSGYDEASAKYGIVARQLLCGMRQADRWEETARAVVDFKGYGVVGFDIAGPELGFPPALQASAFEMLRHELCHITIHAGEADGLDSIAGALYQGAERLGHGVRIVDDITRDEDGVDGSGWVLGPLASYVRDRGIALEVAPTSNLQTGAAGATSIETHPFGLLADLGFNVTINTDNRLMSHTSVSEETWKLVQAFGYDLDDLELFTLNALHAAFLPLPDRMGLIQDVILPGYDALRA
ncbi:adenosine deaminase [Nocardioides sp. Kera G14]|uniref:adenosine deaminase n=1 Tax=Nocardioides sp. Kera G14 TaxID=2884264 RepID=UPI001D118067|nr:adenosine deaminase [Nocardioides sp. Kera G14]UDY24416.1 adenosine deaminase [Nocardioides sp. Kera G14]